MRQWAAADAGELVEIHRDPAMHRWLRVPIHDAGDALRWLDLQHNGWAAGARLSFAVREADDGPIVACVVLSRPRGPGGEVGYWTAAAARGRGIASHAVDSLSRWAFATFATLERLELRHQVDNHASCRVAEKACFALDGVLPAEPPYPLDGHRHVRTRTTFPARECSAVR
jgi:RimJ/RimL family protein N-acetyltransferase